MFGLSPFEILLTLAWLGAIGVRVGEWVFKRSHDGDDCVKRSEWQLARRDDVDKALHFTRNTVNLYVPREAYDRDWKETSRRLEHLEAQGSGLMRT